MELVNTFRKVHRRGIILIVPILFDFLALAIGWAFIGFYGESFTSIRMILEMGMPSVSHISNIALLANNIDFINTPVELPSFMPIIVIIMIIIAAFLQGGYIRTLYCIIRNQPLVISDFFKACKKNVLQFVILEIVVFLLKIGVTAFLVIFFQYIGAFAALVFFIVLRIIFIYLEFTIVVDKVSIPEALKLSRAHLGKTLPNTLPIVLIMYIISIIISFLLHKFWSPYIVIAIIIVYAYFMTIIQSIFMSIFCRIHKSI